MFRWVGELIPSSSRPKFEAAPISIFLLTFVDFAVAFDDNDFGLTVTLMVGFLGSEGVVARGAVVTTDAGVDSLFFSLSRYRLFM